MVGRSRAGDAGPPAADPAVLVALWLYATVDGWVRARELERLAQSDAAYRWLAGGVPLNYHGLADFRVESVEVLDRLLTQSVMALIGEGLVKLAEIAVDGTKIRASASKQSLKTGAKLLEVEAAVAAPRPPCCVLDDAVASLPPDGESLSSRKGTTALLHETEIATLIRKGLLSNDARNDLNAARNAF